MSLFKKLSNKLGISTLVAAQWLASHGAVSNYAPGLKHQSTKVRVFHLSRSQTIIQSGFLIEARTELWFSHRIAGTILQNPSLINHQLTPIRTIGQRHIIELGKANRTQQKLSNLARQLLQDLGSRTMLQHEAPHEALHEALHEVSTHEGSAYRASLRKALIRRAFVRRAFVRRAFVRGDFVQSLVQSLVQCFMQNGLQFYNVYGNIITNLNLGNLTTRSY